MKKEKKERMMNCISFDELLNERCGYARVKLFERKA